MIKPATLWSLFKGCHDSAWLGAVCRALGGQDVELDFGQRQMVDAIRQDSDWMDERIEAQRERWRGRQTAKRERDKRDNGDMSRVTECHGDERDKRDVTVTERDRCDKRDVTIHTSIHPSIHPTHKCVCVNARTRTRGVVDNLGGDGEEAAVQGAAEVPPPVEPCADPPPSPVQVAPPSPVGDPTAEDLAGCGVPDWYVGWWLNEMAGAGWRTSRGEVVGRHNASALIRAWWRRAEASGEAERVKDAVGAAAREKAVKSRVWKRGDWRLCEERCARFRGGRCAARVEAPPDRDLAHPHPPEECVFFSEREGAGDG